MEMKTKLIFGLSLGALLAATPAKALEVESETGGVDAGTEADAAVEAEAAEHDMEPVAPTLTVDGAAPPTADLATEDASVPAKKLIYLKGNKEAGVSLAMAGSGDYFYFGAGASFDYFVMDRLAPGMTVQYTHIFLSQDFGYDEPHTVTLLPFLKFVITQSGTIAPYLMLAGGYQFEWGSKYAVNAGIFGGGAGVNVGITEHVALNIQLLALYYWYGDTRVYGYSDDRIYTAADGSEYVCASPDQCDYSNGVFAFKNEDGQFQSCDEAGGEESCLYQTVYRCDENGENCIPPYSDPADKKREMFFPLITFGVSIFF